MENLLPPADHSSLELTTVVSAADRFTDCANTTPITLRLDTSLNSSARNFVRNVLPLLVRAAVLSVVLRSVLWVYLTARNYQLQEGNKSKVDRNFKCYGIGTQFCEQCVFGPSLWPHNSHPRLVVTAAREVWADSKLNRIIVGLLLHCRSRPLRSWAYYSDMSIRCNVYSVPHEKCQCHSCKTTLPLSLWAFVTAGEQIN
jgi:hypothetical protein